MKQAENLIIKISILDTNIFITEAIEEILRNYPCEIKRVKSPSDVKEFCDYFIFYEESLNENLIEEIIYLPEYVERKVLICNRDSKIPQKLIASLQHIINIKELDFHLKEIMNDYILIYSEKTYEEEMNLIKKLMNDSAHYINSLLMYSEALKNDLEKNSNEKVELIKKYEELLKKFEKEFLGFQNFIFINKVPLKYEDINILIQNVLRERENDLKNKIENLVYLPDYTLPMIKTNSVVITRILNNLLDLILISAKEIQSIEISTKKQNNYLKINFDVICSEFDRALSYQIYNPFFPRSVLENAFINYFRIKIEKFLRMSIYDRFNENKISFVIKMEMGE